MGAIWARASVTASASDSLHLRTWPVYMTDMISFASFFLFHLMFFPSGFSFTNLHDSEGSRESERLFP